MKITNTLDMQKNILQAPVLHPLATAPAGPVVGLSYYDTATGQALFYNGSVFANLATNSPLLNGQNAAFYLARANHTGTQLAATISDLATTVQGYRLDQFALPTASVNLNNQKIINLADPVSAQDAATMGWVQGQVSNAAAGIDAKASVRLKTTANDTLSGLAARDGVTPVANDRVLVASQTTPAQNGVYLAAAGAWTRATDADGVGELNPGAFWYVEEGTVSGKTQWRIENTGTITIGTTPITINQFGGSATSYTGSLGVQLVANDFRAQVVASGGIQAVAGGLQVDPAIVVRKFAQTIGDGSATSIAVTHNLNTQDVQVTIRLVSTNEMVLADWVATSVNVATVTFGTAPTASQYRVVVQG